jgi:hypothetical protein
LWPKDVVPGIAFPDARKTSQQVLAINDWKPPIDASKYSSYWKALRVMAWILRFINNVRAAEKLNGELTARELEAARLRWIQLVQRESFAADYNALKYPLQWARSRSLLQVSRICRLHESGSRVLPDCILDCGSQSSFVSRDLIDQLKINVIGHRDLAVTAFESSHPHIPQAADWSALVSLVL